MRLLATVLLLACASPVLAAGSPDEAHAVAARMGRGVNILGYDGIWEGGTDAPFRMQDLRLIRQAGFGHVRINFHAFKHMDGDDRIDPAVLERLDRVLAATIAAGLIPVLDQHDTDLCQADPVACALKLRAFWRQISERYAHRFPEAVFEILNEPGGAMTASDWNELQAGMLRLIRQTNPHRVVVIAALNTEDPDVIRKLVLPKADRRIIVTVHYYKPFRFTHQGAPWAPEVADLKDVSWGSEAERQALDRDLDVVAAWARDEKRPIYLGEFGVYEKAGVAERARWSAAVARAAEARGWPWAYWQFDHDFALFDSERRAWLRPLLDALIPPAVKPSR